MPESAILTLDAYRVRRDQRLKLAMSLYRADPSRAEVLTHLSRITTLLGADRAATVWIDEYGPGLVHPHVVLDLLSDRPRRSFLAEPLHKAWEGGVPGIFEAPSTGLGRADASGWSVAVALGSDGTRSWFLTVDSVSPRRSLSDKTRGRLMFLAGECSAVVLHRDLDAMARADEDDSKRTRPRFAGWPILQDIEGREEDETESRRIAMRFMVARLPRLLIEDDLAISQDRLRQQADRAREEVSRDSQGMDVGDEGALWSEVLDAFQAGELERLGAALMTLGQAVESRLHLHGAIELYRTAYELFAATGLIESAVDAARFSGRALRRLARWDEALRWYGIAREIASAGSMPAKGAVVLDGMANVHRERGNLPAAKATLFEALPLAETSGESAALGGVYMGLMSAEHMSANLADALHWGWKAVESYATPEDRVTALASLGGVLIDVGALDSAADAWRCALRLSTNDFYRVYASDALGHIAALRGDRSGFARHAADADAMGWESGPASAKAEILHYRGLSWQALGDVERARTYLERAVAYAEAHSFNRTLFAAESALRSLASGESQATTHRPPPAAPEEISSGLLEMRVALEQTALV